MKIKSNFIGIAVVLSTFVFLISCSDDFKVYGDPNTPIVAKVGEKFKLGGFSSGGYGINLPTSELTNDWDANIVQYISTETDYPDSNVMDAPATIYYVFKAVGAGSTSITVDRGSGGIEVFNITVE